MALPLALLEQQRRRSLALCALSGEWYRWAARALGAGASMLLPYPLGVAVMQTQHLTPRGAFRAVHLALQLSVGFCLVLALLFRWEGRARQLYARQHRLVAEAAGLAAARRRCRFTAPLLLVCGAGLWGLCCELGAQ